MREIRKAVEEIREAVRPLIQKFPCDKPDCGWCTAEERVVDAIARALAVIDAGDWQPIESAPKDGTPVLLFDGKGIHDGAWANYPHMPCWDWKDGQTADPTHWKPLPAAPGSKEEAL